MSQRCTTLDTTDVEIRSLKSSDTPIENTYYVSRNVAQSGDGSSWEEAYKTITEAVTEVNRRHTASEGMLRGRNTRIIIDEGFYSEPPITLTANDCHIIGAAPGHHDSTVLYGSATLGGFDIGAGGPALSIRGSNCTIENMGFFTYDVLYAALRIGANAGDPDTPTAIAPTGTAIINCAAIRDIADGCDGGILDYGADGTLIDGCFFSTSCKTYGVKVATNGVINPVNPIVRNSRFVGTPTGILQAAGHNGLYYDNRFMDDTSDRPDTCDTPIVITASSAQCWNNWAQGVNAADVVTGAGTYSEIRNWGDDS
jgi:hypothetical protein